MDQPTSALPDPELSPISAAATGEESRDLGFGAVLSRQPMRLLNRDGTFNVHRKRPNPLERLTSYHGLLTMSWWGFIFSVLAGYLIINVAFAAGYLACGAG